MGKRLLIVESPGKTRKLSQILGPEWIVKASMGHVRELASDGIDSLGFDLEGSSVHCRYVVRGERGKEAIQQLQSAVRQVETVVLATDPDREGETIAWHLQQALKLKQAQRVVYTEITPAAVQAAIAQPRLLDQNLVNSGLCRAVLDKLVGFKGSPLLWSLNNGGKAWAESSLRHCTSSANESGKFKPLCPRRHCQVKFSSAFLLRKRQFR